MRRIRPLFFAVALAAPASAQTGLGIDFGLSGVEGTDKSREEDLSRPLPYAIALEMEFSSSAWRSLELASAPAVEMTGLLYRGYYKLELVEMVLIAEKAGVPFKEVFKKREKDASLKAIAEGYGLDPDSVFEEAIVRRRHLETELLPGLAVSSGPASGVSLSTAPAASPQRRLE